MHKPAAVLVLASVLSACGASPAVDPAADAQEVLQVIRDFEAAWNAHDPAALAAFYTPDGSHALGDRPLAEGRPAVEASWRELMAGFPAGLRIAITADDVRFPSPDVALVQTYGRSGLGADDPRPNHDRGFMVLSRTPDGWRLEALRVQSGEG